MCPSVSAVDGPEAGVLALGSGSAQMMVTSSIATIVRVPLTNRCPLLWLLDDHLFLPLLTSLGCLGSCHVVVKRLFRQQCLFPLGLGTSLLPRSGGGWDVHLLLLQILCNGCFDGLIVGLLGGIGLSQEFMQRGSDGCCAQWSAHSVVVWMTGCLLFRNVPNILLFFSAIAAIITSIVSRASR